LFENGLEIDINESRPRNFIPIISDISEIRGERRTGLLFKKTYYLAMCYKNGHEVVWNEKRLIVLLKLAAELVELPIL
jgi:hypothetical protein